MRLYKGDIQFRQGDSGYLYQIKSGLLKIVPMLQDKLRIATPFEYTNLKVV